MAAAAAPTQKVMAVTEFGKPLKLVEQSLPEPTGDQVLVKTTFAGLCHSDLHQIDGYFGTKERPIKIKQPLPFCVGHEIEGVIVATGPGAKGKVEVGQPVAVFPWGGCRHCGECAVGDENLCGAKHANDIGNGKNMFGGFSSHVLIPTYQYCFDKSGIPDGLAGTYMCSGLTAFSALKKIGTPSTGAKDVLILGLGGVGMQGYNMAKALFGEAPMAADIRPEALAGVRADGGRAFNPKDADCVAQIMKASSDGMGVAAVIDFVGSDQTFALGQRVLRKGGQAIQVNARANFSRLPV